MTNHIINLLPPRGPGAKGDDRYWVLHVFHNPVGRRVTLPEATDADTAKAACEAHLGSFQPAWVEATGDPTKSWPNWPLAFTATNAEDHKA